MRLSLDTNDSAYHPLAWAMRVRFNGAWLPHVLTADEERGEVLLVATAADGWPIITPSGDLAYVVEHGEVSIRLPYDAAVAIADDREAAA